MEEKATRYKTLRVLNKQLFVGGLTPFQLFGCFLIAAVFGLAFDAWGTIIIIPIVLYSRWSKKQVKRGNYRPFQSLMVTLRMPRNIIDKGDFYDNL